MKEFITPPGHIHFLAKKLFSDCGEIIEGSIAYLEKGGGGQKTNNYIIRNKHGKSNEST